MGKPTYDELFKKYLRVEEDREELIFECDWLHDRINKAIEIIDLIKPELWNISNKMTYRLIDIKNILKGSDKE